MFLLCCFFQEERNDWLMQILYVKVFGLVVDLMVWVESKCLEKLIEDVDFEF